MLPTREARPRVRGGSPPFQRDKKHLSHRKHQVTRRHGGKIITISHPEVTSETRTEQKQENLLHTTKPASLSWC